MAKTKRNLGELIGKLIDSKQDKINYIGGLLGTYDSSGNQIIDVENREGFSYVRIGGNQSEVVEAFNPSALSEYDLKILLIKNQFANFYEIIGRDIAQYTTWQRDSFFPNHAFQHQFGTGDNEGADPVFIYKRQLLQPLGVHPTATGSSFTVTVEPDFYTWNGNVNYFPGAESIDLTFLKPLDQGARFVTIYLNGSTSNIAYETGTVFYNLFYNTGTIDNIPEVSLLKGIPLAAIYLTSGTSSIGWDNVFDIRNFLNDGGQTTILHDLDPQYGFHTGTIRSSVSTVVDAKNYYTGTVVEDVLQEIYPLTTGGMINFDLNKTFIGRRNKVNIYSTGTITVAAIDDGNEVNYSINYTGISTTDRSSSAFQIRSFRTSIPSGTSGFDLPDLAEQILNVFNTGVEIDPATYSISSGTNRFIFDVPLTTNTLLTMTYLVLRD